MSLGEPVPPVSFRRRVRCSLGAGLLMSLPVSACPWSAFRGVFVTRRAMRKTPPGDPACIRAATSTKWRVSSLRRAAWSRRTARTCSRDFEPLSAARGGGGGRRFLSFFVVIELHHLGQDGGRVGDRPHGGRGP